MKEGSRTQQPSLPLACWPDMKREDRARHQDAPRPGRATTSRCSLDRDSRWLFGGPLRAATTALQPRRGSADNVSGPRSGQCSDVQGSIAHEYPLGVPSTAGQRGSEGNGPGDQHDGEDRCPRRCEWRIRAPMTAPTRSENSRATPVPPCADANRAASRGGPPLPSPPRRHSLRPRSRR
jgi:hypothetical protein